jgi:DNA polymerase kappa
MLGSPIINPYIKRKRPREKEEAPATLASAPSGSPDGKLAADRVSIHDGRGGAGRSAAGEAEATTATSSSSLPSSRSSSSWRSSQSRSARASALLVSAAAKPGMDGIDRTRIDEIILRESGDSLYMEQQRRRDERVNRRIERMREDLRTLQEGRRRLLLRPSNGDGDRITDDEGRQLRLVDEAVRQFQQQQPTRSTCAVVDLDMFYFACELLTRPELTDKPACVGRGMILTSNYVARRYGVRSAMPGFVGDRLVEELSGGRERLIHVRPNYDLYREKSRIVMGVLKEFDPHGMRAYSLDEASLDLAPYLALHLQHGGTASHEQIHAELLREGNGKDCTNASAMRVLQSHTSFTCLQAAGEVISHLRQRVQQATGGLTCSVGVAPNVAVAKIASDTNKPDGQVLVDPSEVLDFLHELPVRKVPGVGRVTEKILQEVFNVVTVRDLYSQRALVCASFKPATADFLLRASVGCFGVGGMSFAFGMDEDNQEHRDALPGIADHRKGISRERTFAPTSDLERLTTRLEDIAHMLSADMVEKSVKARTVTVKVKLKTFDVLSRSESLKRGLHIQSPEEMIAVASQIFSQLLSEKSRGESPFSVRLLGIRCSNLIEESMYHPAKRMTIDNFWPIAQARKGNDETPLHEDTPSPSAQTTGIANRSNNVYPIAATKESDEIPLAMERGIVGRSIDENQQKDAPSSNATSKGTTRNTIAGCTYPSNATNGTPRGGNDEEADGGRAQCPICNRSFAQADNGILNSHLDSCLSGSTIRRVIEEEDASIQKLSTTSSSTCSSNRERCLTDYWRSERNKL